MKRRLLPLLALALCLCACGKTEAPPARTPAPAVSAPAPTPTPTPTPDPLSEREVLDLTAAEALALCDTPERCPKLRELRLTEPLSDPALPDAVRSAFPQATLRYRVEFCDRSAREDTRELDLRDLPAERAEEAARALALLPELELVHLPESWSAAEAAPFGALPGPVVLDWPFTMYYHDFNAADEQIRLTGVRIDDGGEALRAVLPLLRSCKELNLEYSNLSDEELDALRRDYPEVNVVWRVFFGAYSTRTDVEKLLASLPDYWLDGEDCAPLRYCTKVRYLDLGHNVIDDISFVSSMPELEVCILAINYWTDAGPLANCGNLEYLEMFTTGCRDLTPLKNLTALRHLNITNLKELEDITPLYGLSNLQRLWIGCLHKIPQEQLDEIRKRLPECEINTTTVIPTDEGWRTDPRYYLLRQQFGYGLTASYADH